VIKKIHFYISLPFLWVFKTLILTYRYCISPLIPARCRFDPTCSGYALQALDRFGPFKGGLLTLKRLCKCHPWGSYGYDPVPEKEEKNS